MSMNILQLLILIFLILLCLLLYLVYRRLSHPPATLEPTLVEWLKSMQHSLDDTKNTVSQSLSLNQKNLSDTLAVSSRDMHDRLNKATEVIGELKREAGAFTEIGRSMKELQDFLRSPKLRGNLGESVLQDLVAQIFPTSSYRLQHSFQSGEKVDVALLTDAGILPIDSKFPLDNFQRLAQASDANRPDIQSAFNRDIKKHVSDIARKYILPGEGTLDFALMYIPSESVYYEIASSVSLMSFARSNRVYPVSPNTLYAALQTILLSFEGKKIEHKAKEVFKMLRALTKDYDKTTVVLGTLGTHLTNAYNKFSEVQTSLNSFGQKLSSTQSLEPSSDEKLLP